MSHTWAGVIPAIFVLLGREVPGHTPTPAPPSLVVNEVKQEAEMFKIEYEGKKECGWPRCTWPFLAEMYLAIPGRDVPDHFLAGMWL